MAVRISDYPSGSLSKNDYLEIESLSEKVSYKITAGQIAQLCKLLNNGGFNGQTTKELDEFVWTDAGVYWWEGTPAINGMPSTGLLEIITTTEPDQGSATTPIFIQRLTNGDNVYTRTVDGLIRSPWGILKNVNGSKILSGVTSNQTINFNEIVGKTNSDPFFTGTPTVIVTPINGATQNYVYLVNLMAVDQHSFTVAKFACSRLQPTTSQTTTNVSTVTVVKDAENNDKSETTHTEQTTGLISAFGGWETGENANFEYSWVAMLDG